MKEGARRTRQPIGELSQQLDRRFLRIQRGLVVNMDYIAQMNADDCALRGGVTFLLSRKDKPAIRAGIHMTQKAADDPLSVHGDDPLRQSLRIIFSNDLYVITACANAGLSVPCCRAYKAKAAKAQPLPPQQRQG